LDTYDALHIVTVKMFNGITASDFSLLAAPLLGRRCFQNLVNLAEDLDLEVDEDFFEKLEAKQQFLYFIVIWQRWGL